MKNISKFSLLILVIMLFVACTGCSNSGSPPSYTSEIDINDIDWKFDTTTRYKEVVPCLNFTNNSKVPIVEITFKTKLKKEFTQEQFIVSSIKDYERLKSTLGEITLGETAMYAWSNERAEPGQNINNALFHIGNSALVVNGVSACDMVEPLNVTITYDGTDGHQHEVLYDFETKKTYLDQ